MAVPFTELKWAVPQKLLDVLNTVNWPMMNGNLVQSLSVDLQSYVQASGVPLDPLPPKPPNAKPLRVKRDIPQSIMRSFNVVDWTQVPAAKVGSFASQLKLFIALKGLPTRKIGR